MRVQLRPAAPVVAALILAATAHADEGEGDWRIAADAMAYSDDDSVQIVTPQLAVRRRLDEAGSEASARVSLDVISAASVDVTSHATTRFEEERADVELDLAQQLGAHRPSLAYHLSWEPDYVSQGVVAAVQSELAGSDSVLSLSYGTLIDEVGRAQTPRTTFSESLFAHTLSAGLTQVTDPETIVRGTLTVSLRDGYMEKPYRYVPLFDQAGIDRARADGVELDRRTFDAYRLDLRPPEEVPESRLGLALSARALRYVRAIRGSLRLDLSGYRDNWSMSALTAEPAIAVRLGESVTLQAHVRFYWQSGVYFWQRTYLVLPGSVPRWRTLDRDLSPFWTLSGGARVEVAVGVWSFYAEPGAAYTRFLDFLLLDARLALTGLIGARCTL